nr:GGDEF domain-containing protein [Thiorhodovibrio winogradskyi]
MVARALALLLASGVGFLTAAQAAASATDTPAAELAPVADAATVLQRPIAPLEHGWAYRWGDSPLEPDGRPAWATGTGTGTGADQWIGIHFPSNPPGRDGREHVWYRVPLPPMDWRDPALFIFSVDILVEVYLDGERLYHFGDFDAEGHGAFVGWPWHLISLPRDAGGKTLYFRIFSDYKDIGLWGDILLGERIELVERVLAQSLERLVTGGFSLLIAVLALVLAPLERSRHGFGAIALFAAASSAMLFSSAPASTLMLNRPLLWEFVGAGGYYLIPVAIAWLLEQWLRPARSSLLVLVRWVHIAYFIGALGLAWLGWVSLANTYPLFDALFTITLVAMMVPALRLAQAGTLEQKLILSAVALLDILLLLDLAVAHSLLPWTEIPLAWGVLAFSLVIVIISVRHFAATQRELARLNASLESQVTARTSELERMVEREGARAQLLEIENRKSAELDALIMQLQGCQRLSASEAVLADALPGLCDPLSGTFYLRTAGRHIGQGTSWGPRAPDLDESLTATTMRQESEAQSVDIDASASSQVWPFRLHYEHPQLGDTDLGLLLIRSPMDSRSSSTAEDIDFWWRVLGRSVERINLTLSLLALQDGLRVLSYEDGLTGLKNRRFLDEMLVREIAVAQRQSSPLSLLICDVDHFKRFNDTHGHAAGDEALKQVAVRLRQVFRDTDLICRYGGEEFVLLLPSAESAPARERGETLRAQVASEPILYEGQPLAPVTVSIGIASYPDPVSDPKDLMARADEALYRAKESGRNRIELAT